MRHNAPSTAPDPCAGRISFIAQLPFLTLVALGAASLALFATTHILALHADDAQHQHAQYQEARVNAAHLASYTPTPSQTPATPSRVVEAVAPSDPSSALARGTPPHLPTSTPAILTATPKSSTARPRAQPIVANTTAPEPLAPVRTADPRAASPSRPDHRGSHTPAPASTRKDDPKGVAIGTDPVIDVHSDSQNVAPVTPELVASARKTNQIEGVALTELGVTRLDSNTVQLRNGRTVRIGQRFPTGERLLALDPEASQIVTDKRTIMAF